MQEDFEQYAEKVKTLPESTTDADKLILYGLFKQATVGPVNTSGFSSFKNLIFNILATEFFISLPQKG